MIKKVTLILIFYCCLNASSQVAKVNKLGAEYITLKSASTEVRINSVGLRYSFIFNSKEVAAAHYLSGVEIGGLPLSSITSTKCSTTRCEFNVSNINGDTAQINITVEPQHVIFRVTGKVGLSGIVRTAGISPSYGLGDRASTDQRDDTDLTGFVDDHLLAGHQVARLISNFIIFPKQGMSEVLISPESKILHLTKEENAQGLRDLGGSMEVHYFFGTPREMYKLFAEVRRNAGKPLMLPKYEMYGVGWEAFGALGWDTNQNNIQANVDRYLSLGYPIKWLVIGSGFWPAKPDDMHETTSFGYFDSVRYPTPRSFFQHFHDEGLKVLLGLRITFVTTGPFAAEGVKNGYFIQEHGQPVVYRPAWPKLPCYLLNAQIPEAVDWYVNLVSKWKAYGVDGFKEDFYGYSKYQLRDDKLDPVNKKLMAEGYDLIERNGYLTSDGDIHRIDDFNYNQDQDRGPVNALSLAYSGLPLIYPDIVGGTFSEDFDTKENSSMATYMMRNAQWSALHSSMSMGQPPWSFQNPKIGEVMLKAAKTHQRLQPYIYSQAVRFTKDGYPWTMAPLSIAYPHESGSYGRENRRERGYEWMIGDALLATPLYGDDYASAHTRNIYLPKGKWMEYETGKVFSGPILLHNYEIPIERTPLFVGGTGIILENSDHGVVVRVYPITPNAHTELWSSDGIAHSSIDLNVNDWKNLKITDVATHGKVEWKMNRFAAEFPFTPGHSYVIK